MRTLRNYILEELDDNIFWLIDKWFERNEQQYKEFIELLVKSRENGDKVNVDDLKKNIKGTSLEKNLKEFVNFIDNEVHPTTNKDYLYSLKQIIEIVMGKKENNKYLNL